MSDAPTPLVAEEYVFAPVLLLLSSELYTRKFEIIREYIQNASDAIDAYAAIADHLGDTAALRIKLSVQGKSLIVFDNGIGMDEEEVRKLRYVAYSEKREGHEAGHKGIGRLAGIAVAKRLVISTTTFGNPKRYEFEFRAQELRDDIAEKKRQGKLERASEVIDRYTTLRVHEVPPDDHYTLVELHDIDDAHADLLDPERLREYIGEIGPVGFDPTFTHAEDLTQRLHAHIPTYSPKSILLTAANNQRVSIYKPYSNAMSLYRPDYIEVRDADDPSQLLAYCWYAAKGGEVLGKFRATGGRFALDSEDDKNRFAGLVYKVNGFSVGDRNLPLTLFGKEYTRALWFTGEIYIADMDIKPTTPRTDFIDNDARARLYGAAKIHIVERLTAEANRISDMRAAYKRAAKGQATVDTLKRLIVEQKVTRATVKKHKAELDRVLHKELKKDSKDKDISDYSRQVAREVRTVRESLNVLAGAKEAAAAIIDLAADLQMTGKARRVYMIVMEALEHYYRDDPDTYYEVAAEVESQLRKHYQ